VSLFLAEIDRLLAAHVGIAIRRHREYLERTEQPEPDGLREIEQTMTRTASNRQEPPATAIVGLGDHSALRDREYLSPSEAATVTGLGKRTIERLVSDGSLSSTLVGRSRRIARGDLDELMVTAAQRPSTP
jgi:excisionase family DNA binding protein